MSDLTPGDVVRRFCEAMATLDPDAPMAYAADTITFENVPMPLPAGSVTGADAVRQRLAAWMGPAESTTFTIHRQIETGEVVMHERTDEIVFPDGMFPGKSFAMPIMAVWEVRNGKIELWRDYYDFGAIPDGLGVDLAEFARVLGQAYAG
jgi:limonene-1,2-epoxide hydrolase